MKKTFTQAFTLIEILVVISIITLLLSILLPALGRAREQARFAVCRSNMHQYSAAGYEYIMDNSDNLPDFRNYLVDGTKCPQDVNNQCLWHNTEANLSEHPKLAGPMWSYFKSREAGSDGDDFHVCPSFGRRIAPKFEPKNTGHIDTIPIDTHFSYAMNGWIKTPPFPYPTLKKLSMVNKPLGQWSWFMEQNLWPREDVYGLPFSGSYSFHYPMVQPPEWKRSHGFGTFHFITSRKEMNSGRSNIAFGDGHVEDIRVETYEQSFRIAWPYKNPKF